MSTQEKNDTDRPTSGGDRAQNASSNAEKTLKSAANKSVAVIGAGVAGLTAAHELAERGFKVYVFDAERDVFARPSSPLQADTDLKVLLANQQPVVGGLAATQWYRVAAPFGGRPTREASTSLRRLQSVAEWTLAAPEDWPEGQRDWAYFEGRWPIIPGPVRTAAVKDRVQRIAERLDTLLGKVQDDETLVIGIVADCPEDSKKDADEQVDETLVIGGIADTHEDSTKDANAVTKALLKQLSAHFDEVKSGGKKPADGKVLLVHKKSRRTLAVRSYGLGQIHADDKYRPEKYRRYVELRLHERLLPGEHGYRFFPSFYHHTFDTMRRIRLLAPERPDRFRLGVSMEIAKGGSRLLEERLEATGRTVFDNLRSVELHAFDSGTKTPVRPMTRFNTRSLGGVLELLDGFQAHSDVPLRDIVFGQLKMLRYATSSRARREGYSHQTWSEFAEVERGGREFRDLLEHWPQALVGLQASRADARTTGTILLQLLQDQVRSSGFRDGTLNAPTTEAWLTPWKRYLESEYRVEFKCVKVKSLSLAVKPDGVTKVVHIKGIGCDGKTEPGRTSLGVDYDYCVVATSADAAKALGEASPSLRSSPEYDASPFGRLKGLIPKGQAYKKTAESSGPFVHFSGIQFFLKTDFARLRGHIYYPNSPWRLSSVSQVQFRLDGPGVLDAYNGVISVVIGAFDQPGHNELTAWESTPKQLADEVWDQITRSFTNSGAIAPPKPAYYAIDRNLIFAEPKTGKRGKRGIQRNETPFLVNAADRADDFPEEPGAYAVYFDRIVFAGTYVRTHTRLVTMEAANESARHAVNAVIRHSRDRGVDSGHEVRVFDPEEREPEQLALIKEIDAALVSRGLPHWMDILNVEQRILTLLGDGDAHDTRSALLAALESAGGIGAEILRIFRRNWPS